MIMDTQSVVDTKSDTAVNPFEDTTIGERTTRTHG